MAETEPVVEVVEPVVEPAAEPVEPVVEVKEPHPLEQGGERFEQVYARMKQAEQEARDTRDRLARAEGQLQTMQRPVQPQQATYTPDQLQALVDRGQITPMQAADVLAAQRSVQSAGIIAQQQAIAMKTQSALKEVNEYIDKMPQLGSTGSSEFQKVARAAYEIAEDMGLPATDPRVQRQALRVTFGTLDKVARVASGTEAGRRASIPHSESGSGGEPAPAVKSDEALKGVPARYLNFWKSKGYTPKRMAEEAALLTPRQREQA